ncbi:MAG TPA: C4-dicarboxylate ABC transporter, partial [Limnochordia bacterium]
MRRAVEHLSLAAFTWVMATAALSIGADLAHWPGIARGMGALAAVGHGVLTTAMLARAAVGWAALRAELTDPARGFTSFAFVAANGVLGVRASLWGMTAAAVALWAVAAIAWLVLIYGLLLTLFVANERSIRAAVNGSWLIAVVGTQALAALSAVLAIPRPPLALLGAYGLWAVGTGLYLILITVIFLRLAFFPVRPPDLTPPYWINMGAVAISAVAAFHLFQHPPVGALAWLRPV